MIYKIDFCDFWDSFDKEDNYFINTLRNIYGNEKVVISKQPDFLFFSCFGFKNLRYDCVKIFFTGENLAPDFNICDYAIGMHEIQFEDRYFRLPFFMLYPEMCQKAIFRNRKDDYVNRKFCCYVISNTLGASQRNEMINLLASYKKIDSGGKLNNNVGGPVKDKLKFISDYKFSMCFENSSSVGYTTEKIVEGFAGGGIPIYWGNPNATKEFNPDAFVNCNDFDNLSQALDYIKYLDTDDAAYARMVHAPIFAEGQDDFSKIQYRLEEYLIHILDKRTKRINDIYIGRKYMCRMKFFAPWFDLYRIGERSIGYAENLMNTKRKRYDYSSDNMS